MHYPFSRSGRLSARLIAPVRRLAGIAAGVLPLVLLALVPSPAWSQSARFTFQSDPGDFVGQGQTFSFIYTPANTVDVGGVYSAGVLQTISGAPSYIRFAFQTPGTNRSTRLDFSTNALGIPLAVGDYLNAERAAFASAGHPGLDITFQNRGSNTLTGRFSITDISFVQVNSSLEIDRFAGTFEQHSEGAVPALRGTFAYLRNGILTEAPEPGSLALLTLSALPALAVIRRKRAT